MKLKLVLNLLLAVVVVWVLTRIVQPKNGGKDAASRLVPDQLLEDATTLSITHGTFSAQLERNGHSWEIRKPIAATADRSVVLRIFSLLENARRAETITQDELRRRELTPANYGLQSPRASITVSNATSVRTIWFGDDAPLGNRVYITLSGSHDIIAVTRDVFDGLPAGLSILRDTTAFRGDPTRTKQVEIHRLEKPFVKLARTGNDWTLQQPVESDADSHKVDAMLRSLFELRVRRFISDPTTDPSAAATSTNNVSASVVAYGLNPDEAPAQIDILQGGSPAMGILFGKPTPDVPDEVYAKLTTSDSIFTVPKAALDGVLVDLDDLRSRSLFSLTPRQVLFVRLQTSDKRLLLRRTESGLWNLVEPLQWPADQALLSDLINQIVALKVDEFPNRMDSNPATGGFEPPAFVIQIGQSIEELDEKTSNRLLLAQQDPALSMVYVKRASDSEIFGIQSASAQTITGHAGDPFYFADRTVLAVEPSSIQTISTFDHGTLTTSIRRSEHNTWSSDTQADRTVSASAVESIIFNAANLRAESITGFLPADLEPYDLGHPAHVITVGLSGTNGIQRSILIGKPANQTASSYYACVRGQDLLFQLSRETVSAITTSLFENASQPKKP